MLCPERFHKFRMLVVVHQSCLDLSVVQIELRRHVVDGEVLPADLGTNLQDTDPGTLDPRFSVGGLQASLRFEWWYS